MAAELKAYGVGLATDPAELVRGRAGRIIGLLAVPAGRRAFAVMRRPA